LIHFAGSGGVRTKTPELDQRILDTAARLFAGAHFHEVRMEDIASEADVGKGTLYRYFRDKEELYLALLSRAAQQMHERLHETLGEDLEPVAKLQALVDMTLEFFDEQRHVFEIIQQVEASRGTNHPWQRARDSLLKETVGVFAEAKRRGDFTVADPPLTALMLLASVRAVIRFGPKPRPDGLGRQIVDTILNGAARDLKRDAGRIGRDA
jgi:AcrR family transcriptional regulator